jgi:hypothetical protein
VPPDVDAALDALDRGDVVAVVYEAPILQHGVRDYDASASSSTRAEGGACPPYR